MSDKVKISYSSVRDFKKCPTKMYNKKQYRSKEESSALSFGSAIEAGVECLLEGHPLEYALGVFKDQWKVRPKNNYEKAKPIFDNEDIFYYNSDFDDKLIDEVSVDVMSIWASEIMGKDFKDVSEIKDFVKSIQTKLKMDQSLGQKEKKLYNRIMWYCCRKKGPYMIKAFKEELLPKVEEVIETQKKISTTNGEDGEFVGYVDFILKLKGIKDPVIIDLKTASRDYDDHKLDTSDQLRAYAAIEGIKNIGYMVLKKNLDCELSCDVCGHIRINYRLKNCEECKKKKKNGKYVNQKLSTSTQLLVKTLKKKELQDTLDDFSEVLSVISSGISWKNPDSCFDFNTKCEFYDHCWNGKNLSELEHLKKK